MHQCVVRKRWYLLHSINQRLIATLCAGIYYSARQLFRSLITQLPCGCIFKAISPLPFCCPTLWFRVERDTDWDLILMLLHLCSIGEGSLLHVARITRPRLTASFWYYARIYLRGLLLPRNWFVIHLAHWVSVKSVVAVLMVVLLLWGLKWLLQRDILLHLCLNS